MLSTTHRLVLFFLSFSVVTCLVPQALAETLCVKSNTKLTKKGKVRLGRTFRVVPGDRCPGGFTSIFESQEIESLNSNQVFEDIKQIDGDSSGLDADTLDGKQGSEFATELDLAGLSTRISDVATQVNTLEPEVNGLVADVTDVQTVVQDLGAQSQKFASEKLVNMRFVDPVNDGTDFAANGQALRDALQELVSINPPPSAENQWVLKIKPGSYDLGNAEFNIPEYIHLEGAGADVTKMKGARNNSLIVLNSHTSLKSLSLENSLPGGPTLIYGVTIGSGAPAVGVLVENVKIHVSAATPGFIVGIFLSNNCDVVIRNTQIRTESNSGNNRAINSQCNAGQVLITDAKLESVGTSNISSFIMFNSHNVTVRNSQLLGDGRSFTGGFSAGTKAFVVASELEGDVVPNVTSVSCHASYQSDGGALAHDCAPIP